ncbi:MAG: sulfite exporter TauE/SafE family protein [candidate division Zixibacteria bacterium]
MDIIYLVLTGFLAGIVGSLMGLGGGIIMVPVLTLIFSLPVSEAVGTSLLGVVAVSTGAAIGFLKSGRANLPLGLTLETVSAAGALCGGLLAGIIRQEAIYIMFGLILLYASYNMARPRKYDYENGKADFPRRMPIGMGLSFFAGNLSGLLGVGGGVIKVPMLNLIMGVPLKIATATSSYMVGITAGSGALVYLFRGDIDLNKAAAIVVGIFFGSRLGASISYRINALFLRLIFVAVMLFTAYKMIIRGF